MSRPGAIAVVAVVSALLGGTFALAFGKAVGWVAVSYTHLTLPTN